MDLSAISSVVRTIGGLLAPEVKSLLGVEELVEDLHEELIWMQSFLEEANARKADNKVVRLRVARIRELAYDAEDAIETFALKVASRRKGGFSNIIKRYASILREGWSLRQTKCEIEKITAKITKLTQRLQTYDVKMLGDGEASSSSNYQRRWESRRSYSHVIGDNIVGLDDDIKKLVPILVGDQESDCRAVSIYGMGGLGKTTLAKKIFRDSKVRSHFHRLAWVYVSQQFQHRKVWEDILSDLGFQNDEKMTDEQLPKELCDFLKGNKCLVILDDIWTQKDWEILKPAFPGAWDNSSSKILLTTRKKEVVSSAGDIKCYEHELQPLKENERWELFKKIAFSGGDNSTDPEIKANKEKLGKEMLVHCEGLPLAIVALGGILRERSSPTNWKIVHKNVTSQLKRGKGRGIHDVLDLSYDDLPPYLKPCFLYLSHFPEDYKIDATRLIQLWVAEGFISWNQDELNEGEIAEDVAEGYLNELAERCMIQVVKRDKVTLKIKSCRMHDLMRDLCLSKAKQENLLRILDCHPNVDQNGNSFFSSTLDRSARRIVANEFLWLKFIRNPHLRSIFFFDDFDSLELIKKCLAQKLLFNYAENHEEDSCNHMMMWASRLLGYGVLFHKYRGIWAYLFNNFKLVRVLNFEGSTAGAIGCKLPTGIGNLIHLRFLNLNNLVFFCSRKLPSSLGNLRYLQTLDLRLGYSDDIDKVHVPNVIWRLQRLRHLYLPVHFECKTKLKLHSLRNLVTLVNFDMENCCVQDLSEMINLRELEIYVSFTIKDIKEHFLNKNHPIISSKYLRSLCINSRFTESLDPGLLASLLSCCADNCELSVMVKIGKLPEYYYFSSNIAYIHLKVCFLEEDPMPTLKKLPNLKILELQRKAFKGTKMVCSQQGFWKLESLSLGGLINLKEWKVEKGTMPALRRLEIRSCWKMKMLPDGLKFITALQELKIVEMPTDFKLEVEEFFKPPDENLPSVPSITFENMYDMSF